MLRAVRESSERKCRSSPSLSTVRGLNDFLTFDVTLNPANQVIETDGTLPTEPATGFYQSGTLTCEGFHLTKRERATLAETYKQKPFSFVFRDQQYASSTSFALGTVLPSTQTFNLTNINQPVMALFFVFRWLDDLSRVAGGAGGVRGRNTLNVAGWCK